MMKHVKKLGAAAAMAIGFFAQTLLPAAAGEVQNRIDAEHARVHAGSRHGEIGPSERHRDNRRLAHITAERNRDLRRHHGHITPREERHLNHELNRNSHVINNQNRR